MWHIRSSVSCSLPSLLLPLPSSGIIQYGDLEFFLSELRLGQYIHPLREQGTTFTDLLSVTDEGLIKVCVCVCACVSLLNISHISLLSSRPPTLYPSSPFPFPSLS